MHSRLVIACLLLLAGHARAVCERGTTGKAPNCKFCPVGSSTIRDGDNLPCNVCGYGLEGKFPNCKPCIDFFSDTIVLKDGTTKCVCPQSYTGTYPNCKLCPAGLGTTKAGDGQKCRCVQNKQKDYFFTAYDCPKCDSSKGWYKSLLEGFYAANLKPAPKNVCVNCNPGTDGRVFKTVKGIKYCGCDTKSKFGYWGVARGPAYNSQMCIKCTMKNAVIDSKGRCMCKKGYGISRNVFGGDDYCMPCGGKTSTLDSKGFCSCKAGYAFDLQGAACIACKGPALSPNKEGTCDCSKGYYGGTQASGGFTQQCKKCAPGQSSEVLGGNPLSVCYCTDPGAGVKRDAAYENGCVCRWGFQLKKGTTACEYNPFCKTGEYIIQFWSGKALPAGWNKKSFPRAVLAVKPTAVKRVQAGKSFKWVGTATGLPKGVDAKLYVARIRRCTCVPHRDFSSRFNFFFKVTGGAGARVEIDGGINRKDRCAGEYYDQNACLRPLITPVSPVPGTATKKGTTIVFPQYKDRPGSYLSGFDYIPTAKNYKACHNVTVLFWNNALGGQLEVKLPGSTLN